MGSRPLMSSSLGGPGGIENPPGSSEPHEEFVQVIFGDDEVVVVVHH